MLDFFTGNGADARAVDGEGRNLLHLMASAPLRLNLWDSREEPRLKKEEDDGEVWQALTRKEGVVGLDPSDKDYQQRCVWDWANVSGKTKILGRVECMV